MIRGEERERERKRTEGCLETSKDIPGSLHRREVLRMEDWLGIIIFSFIDYTLFFSVERDGGELYSYME